MTEVPPTSKTMAANKKSQCFNCVREDMGKLHTKRTCPKRANGAEKKTTEKRAVTARCATSVLQRRDRTGENVRKDKDASLYTILIINLYL